ncbi:MAG: sulfotransferase family 2 domain-containing protein [Roseinatronobacter sp.]
MSEHAPFARRMFAPIAHAEKDSGDGLFAQMLTTFGHEFSSVNALESYLKLIVQPPSGAWRYQFNGKSGNTFVLNLMFELEHGVPFTARVDPAETGNQHPDFALFAQVGAGLLVTALNYYPTVPAFNNFPGLRLATVRNPYQRAISGFHYLCRSHRIGDRRFLNERLRMMALAGLNFETMSHTAQGFARFLGYVRDYAATFGADAVDPHWRAQALHIRPQLYRPDILGRTEELDLFAAAVAARLGKPLLSDTTALRQNAGEHAQSVDWLQDPALRQVIEQVYAQDFELFDYARLDPG